MAGTISKTDCEGILKKVYPQFSDIINVQHFQLLPLSEKSTGFFGVHSQIRINIGFKEYDMRNNVPSSLNFFVKSLPEVSAHRKYLEEIDAFRKEVESFKIILPMMTKLSKQKTWAPVCFLARADVLVLENLVHSGFKNGNGLFDRNHLIVAAECLGHFHSSSLKLEQGLLQGDPSFKMVEHFGSCLNESLFVEDQNNVRYHWFHSGVNTLIKMIRLMKKYEGKVDEIEARVPVLLDTIRQTFKADRTKINVVCHGDLWTNNIMFKYDDNDIPIDCRLIDFQIMRYAPNTLDITCMVVLCADRFTREQNLLDVMKSYVNAFNSQLVTKFLDLDRILKEYEEFRMAALMKACLFETVNCLDEEIIDDFLAVPGNAEDFFYGDRDKFVLPAFEKDAAFRARMTELIEEFIESYVLN